MITIPEHEFAATVLDSAKPILVDFTAGWCNPCKMLGNVLAELEPRYAAKVDFVKVRIDSAPRLKKQYAVLHIPRLLLFKDGKIIADLLGMQTEHELTTMLDKALI